MRINNTGHYKYCRWADKNDRNAGPHIRDIDPKEFFQKHMMLVRQQLLEGNQPAGCHECALVEQHKKISGRQRQLLKVGVKLEQFEKTLSSSPWLPVFASDKFAQLPQDWQIDLGNYCNSACVFCSPGSSSKLAAEWKRIGFIQELPAANWCDDPSLIAKLIDTLTESSHIQYLHFIGGETVITPAFKIILQALIDVGLNRTATIGFTTNLSVWPSAVIDLLLQFQGVNLGMSIESFDPINEYVRWPARLPTVLKNLDRWVALAQQNKWLSQFRITPTALTVSSLLTIYEYAWTNNISVESCNFLNEPACLRPSVLPTLYRQPIIDAMQAWIDCRPINSNTVVNTRDPNIARQQLTQDLQSYVNYLSNAPDESNRLPDMVNFLKRIEPGRKNSILTYLPEYENLFRSAGY